MRCEITRREFLKTTGIVMAGLALPEIPTFTEKLFAQQPPMVITNFFETPVGKARTLLIRKRQIGQYRDDEIMRIKYKVVASHQNPTIKKFYKEFAKHPLSEVSEALLHTHYKKRG
jgi:ferredoxin hydrogenase small subunit